MVYDSYSATVIDTMLTNENSEWVDFDSLWLFNQFCMFLDSINICLGSISLLKYTSLAVPDLNVIILTMTRFLQGTVRKTLFMIFCIYLLFGFMSYYFLSYYQYGFFFLSYALLRSCIVFLNGFIVNE